MRTTGAMNLLVTLGVLLSSFSATEALRLLGNDLYAGTQTTTRTLLGKADHTYKTHEKVALYANKVGPFHNPSETYEYYRLPFCPPEGGLEHKSEDLGEVLIGDRLVTTPYEVSFRVDHENEKLCSSELVAKDLKKFRKAVKDDYYFQMYYDDLPLWGFIGKVEKILRPGQPAEMRYYLFTHVHFDISYNDNRIIEINVSTDPLRTVDITEGDSIPVEFSYSVKWKETSIPFDRRMEKYSRYSFLPQHLEIHWFSIINSLMIVLFLSGMVAMIMLRTLHRDISKYNQLESADEAQEESGWKLVHGDVFRAPSMYATLTVYVGTGCQICGMTIVTLCFAVLGFLSPANRGGLMTAMLLLFALMGVAAGYFSARLFKMMQGTDWKTNTLNVAFLFPTVVFAIFFGLNMLIWGQRSSGAVPFGTLFALFFLWFGISVPLVFIGSYFGYKKPAIEDPVRTNKIPRQIPEQAWYMHPIFSIFIGGILPFGAVFIELFFILTSIWLHQFYYIFGFLFIVFVILIVTCAEITIVLCYFQLCSEDYHWWWRAFLTSGSSAIYLFAYSSFYFFTKLDITMTVSAFMYFGYMFIISLGFFLLTGTIGFYACFLFVRTIYAALKID
mmetsp:Transcript_32648/g.39520  ORF Transcript_32648/g.39520 Transcript_32648/m.39520 type:complete len:615 (+) Transcript_32648:134-1978(+)